MMHSMNDPASMLSGMMSFDSISLYEQPKPRFIFKMPRVVPDQKAKFESDELFRRLSRESEVRYTGFRDRPQEERIMRFQNACREGHTEIAFAATGTNLQLVFAPPTNGYMPDKECDFEKEPGKVSYLLISYKTWGTWGHTPGGVVVVGEARSFCRRFLSIIAFKNT
nr:unnamed protein product [Callosobruchus chinensis]